MNDLKSKDGISIVALVVTVIVLLILTGVTIEIANDLIIDKAILVSNKTAEAALKEKIELVLAEMEISYWMDEVKDKSQYLKQKLEEITEIENVEVSKDSNENLNIVFFSQNQKYKYEVLSNKEVKLVNPLKGNVKLGDYVEYPIEYIDVYSEKSYSSTNGWRVIDDGVMEGTSGYVKIISTGIPAKWAYEGTNNRLELENLTNHFEDIVLRQNDITEIKGSQFKVETIANKITTLSLSDLNQVYNILYKTNRDLNDTSTIDDVHELFNLKSSGMFYYWLATVKEDNHIGFYFISDEGIDYYNYYNNKARFGIRPVIYLKDGLNCKLENNIWKVID